MVSVGLGVATGVDVSVAVADGDPGPGRPAPLPWPLSSPGPLPLAAGAVTLASKLIDGTFPEYERVIPKDNDKVLRVGVQDFSNAVARVAAISSERSRPINMSLSQDLLTLSAGSPEQGTASEELDSDRLKYGSPPLEIGFQARYLSDITDQIAGEVEFHFSDGSAPTVVRDAADASALYVLMPMRV